MNASFKSRHLFFAAMLALALSACVENGPVAPQNDPALDRVIGPGAIAIQRPIEDFIIAQGSTVVLGEAQTYFERGALAWYDQERGRTASIDYAGAIRRAFLSYEPNEELMGWPELKFAGRVSEQPMPDGSARVTVELYSEDASSYVVAGLGPFGEKVIFGGRVPISAKGSALGWAKLVVSFRTGFLGAPLPDLWQLIAAPQPGQRLEYLRFHAEAESVDPETGVVRRCIVDQPGYYGWMPRLAPLGTIPVTIRIEGGIEEPPPVPADS